jgi:putative RNA 2'-phosphotransferase
MISEKENKHISKFLSLVLRHKPETINISLDENGWTSVDKLIHQFAAHGVVISKEILEHIVDSNAKKRFAFNDDKTLIRASQGHSVEVALNYDAQQPPKVLYHGTAETSVESIMKTGLDKRSRHHVHLSDEVATAINVGQRYGKPVVLEVAAMEMFNDGYVFYRSDNNVWLTDHVPVKYIRR